MDTDVLIVGAGPTGLMLANQLASRGVRAMIIDRHSGPAQQSRAMAVQARTLEIYSQLGIAAGAMDLGRRGTAFNMWAGGSKRARIPLGDIGAEVSPFPFVLMLGQDDNERIMGARLRDFGLEVQWNTELVALDQRPGHVDATVRRPDGSLSSIRAAYVGGCDGSRSPVRELSGIGFPGAPYEHVFFVADTEVTGSMVPEEVNIYLWRDGFHLFFPMRGRDRWRVIGILPEALRGRDDVAFEELVPAVREEAGANLAFRECSWFSTYRIHHRAAERFRDRRVFLLGDAAHVHSPAGAQGMNTGLQDADNLAWKLALVVSGRADATLLDTYEAERLPVARRLLETTDRAFRLLVSKGWLGSLWRTRLVPRVAAFAMSFERVRRLAFRTISQVGVRYRRSPLSINLPGLPQEAPRAGDRFPWMRLRFEEGAPAQDLFGRLDDRYFNLLLIGQPAAATELAAPAGLMGTVAVDLDGANRRVLGGAGITAPCYFLLRPDGHVGLAGARFEPGTVVRYLNDQGIRP